jgi:hypothetical protein
LAIPASHTTYAKGAICRAGLSARLSAYCRDCAGNHARLMPTWCDVRQAHLCETAQPASLAPWHSMPVDCQEANYSCISHCC